jgi:DUF4097 and DUF4098 domain-containing protein YvlB
MSDNRYTFETPGPVDLKVELQTGQIDITSSDDPRTTIELTAINGDSYALELIDGARVDQHGDKVSLIMPKGRGGGLFGRKGQVRATISVPHETNLRIDSGTADIDARGRFGQANVRCGSGDVELDQIGSGDVQSGSGDVEIQRVVGSVKVKTGSGDVRVGPIGDDGDVSAGSGDVVLDTVEGTLKIKTGSGDIVVSSGGSRVDAMAGSGDVLVKRVDHGELVAKTGSGDVVIGVASGTAAYLDIQTVTGDVKSSLDNTQAPMEGDATVSISVTSGTGDVVLQRA